MLDRDSAKRNAAAIPLRAVRTCAVAAAIAAAGWPMDDALAQAERYPTRPVHLLEGFGAGAGVRYIGESFGDDENSFKVASATLADAAIHYDWKNMKFQLNASNLFDKQYVASCYNRGSGCFYGEGRKISGSIKYRW